MSSFVELQILKEEERVLMNIASRLSDQLNRLKVCFPHCIFHQIAFHQGAAILDAIRQGRPFCMAQQKMYSPQKWVHSIVMLGAKLHSTCIILQMNAERCQFFMYLWCTCTWIPIIPSALKPARFEKPLIAEYRHIFQSSDICSVWVRIQILYWRCDHRHLYCVVFVFLFN